MNLINIIISSIFSICDILLITYYLKSKYVERKMINKIVVSLEVFIFILINSRIMSSHISYILLGVNSLLIIKHYKIPYKKQIEILLSILLLNYIVEALLIFIFNWLLNTSLSLYKQKYLSMYVILTLLTARYLFLTTLIYIMNRKRIKKIKLYYFKWISLFVSVYFSLTVILLDDTLFYFPNIGRTFVFIVIVYNFALIMFDRYQRKAEETEKEFIITKQRIEDDKKYLIKTEAAHDEMRAFRHDLTNKLSIISSLIQRDEKDIALKHLEEMGVTIASSNAKIYIGDPSVDSIIDARVDDMLSKGITFEDSYGLICIGRIDSYDLALLFALALDNAIEAVERITEGERRISLDIHTQREFLYINIENTFISKGKNDFTRTSKKTNIESHGFGVKKMKSLVNKYDGLMDYHFNGNSVMLKIVLNNNYIKENV